MALQLAPILDVDPGLQPVQSPENRRDELPHWQTLFGDSDFDVLRKNSRVDIDSDALLKDDFRVALVSQHKKPSHLSAGPVRHVLVLPFTWQELIRRVGQLKSSRDASVGTIVRFGEVRVNFVSMQVSRSKKPIALKPKEFRLLKFLTGHPQRVFSRSELLNEVWGYRNYPSTRTVDNHVCMLRRKLESNAERPRHLITVHGIGYKFVP
jgi:DNA-binding winged helix-turn-helix (wHTH) protein